MISLPIDALLPGIVSSLQRTSNLVIQASPGAGKTTRVPPALLGFPGEIVVLEPRRLAARLSARRVSEELGEEVGHTVGYQVRLEERRSAATRIRFITEGILTRQMLSQPTLPGVGVVILDEFHERHVASDVALAMLRRLQQTKRPELRLVVMSATLHSEALSTFLGDAPIIRVDAKRFAVETSYLSMQDERPIEQQVYSSLSRALSQHETGDALIFLPGTAEIRKSIRACEGLRGKHSVDLLPLYGDLSAEEQDLAVQPSSRRKVIFATNVAETSITIDGVSIVIDSGLARVASYSAWSGLPTLRLSKVSRASCIQREGRAGRTRDGVCYRLFTQHDFNARPAFETPELLRLDLAETALFMHGALGASLPQGLWLDAPPEQNWQSAEELLVRLGALAVESSPRGAGGGYALTPLGSRMLRFPLHPRLARLALYADEAGYRDEGLRLAALLGEQERSSVAMDDPLLLLEKLQGRSLSPAESALRSTTERLARQLSSAMQDRPRVKASGDAEGALSRALMVGYPDRIGRVKRLSSTIARGDSAYEIVFAAGGSAAYRGALPPPIPEYVVALDAENRSTSKGSAAQVRSLCSVALDWIMELFFDELQESTETKYNHSAHRVEATRRLFFQGLLLEETPLKSIDAALRSEALLAAVSSVGLAELGGAPLASLIAKVSLLQKHKSEAGFPALTDDFLQGLLPSILSGLQNLNELRGESLVPRIIHALSHEQQRMLQELLPERVALPGGRKVAIEYEDGVGPSVSSRLQDFFGMKQGPALFSGRLPLVLHLLAPNGRDVQVTTDLAGFWRNHYPSIAKELRRKYPRHSWPDDPLTAEPPPPRPPFVKKR